jgi:hypothetical protein
VKTEKYGVQKQTHPQTQPTYTWEPEQGESFVIATLRWRWTPKQNQQLLVSIILQAIISIID